MVRRMPTGRLVARANIAAEFVTPAAGALISRRCVQDSGRHGSDLRADGGRAPRCLIRVPDRNEGEGELPHRLVGLLNAEPNAPNAWRYISHAHSWAVPSLRSRVRSA